LDKPLKNTEEEEATIATVLVFVLRTVGAILLVEVVFWRVSVLLAGHPCQICLDIDFGINVLRFSEPLQG
jgi:hypothetical protein